MQAIVPVVAVLRASDWFDVVSYATHESWQVATEMGLPTTRLDELEFTSDPRVTIRKLFDDHDPDLVLSGLSPARGSAPETPEQFALLEARRRGVPSLAIQDYWGMYTERFSRDGNTLDQTLLPDRLCVLDYRAWTDLATFGVPVERMMITHNPWLDRLVAEAAVPTPVRYSSGALNILLASQPIAEMQYARSRPYDQYLLFETLIAAIPETDTARPGAIIQVLPHPSEDRMNWQAILAKNVRVDVGVELCDAAAPELLRNVDYVVTSHSTLAYEALYFGTPCISLRPGAESLALTWGDDVGLSQVFHDTDSLRQYLRLCSPSDERMRILALKQQLASTGFFFSDGKATERVVNEIYKLLDCITNT